MSARPFPFPSSTGTSRSRLVQIPLPSGPSPSRAPLATFVELADQAFAIADSGGTLLWCNAALERALGARPEELLGRHLDDRAHPEDADIARRAALELRRTGELAPTTLRLRGAGGGYRWLEWTARLDGERGRVYAAARDITDRLATEAALRQSVARLEAIMRHSPSVIFVKDLEGRYLTVNEGFALATGIPVDSVPGLRAEDCWPEDAGTIRRSEQMLFGDGASLVTDERMHTVDGPRDFMVNRFLLRDERGTPFAVGGIGTDVTERIRAEHDLAVRDRLLDSVIKASPDMITLMDGAGKIHQISEARSAIFGYGDFSRSNLFDFVHPADRDQVASVFVRLATGAVPHLNLRYRVHHAEGHWVTVDSRAQAMLDAEGRFAGAVVVSRDISDRLESEERLRESRATVEQASRAKSEFLSRMSHELRTPLNSILGFAQLLQMDALPPEQAEAVEHILRAGHHLLDLIDEVLDIARIESGHLELTVTSVPVDDVVREAVELSSPMAARAEVVMRAAPSPAGLAVRADRQRLMQVLLNVLSNAVKYNRPGGRVDVSAAPVQRGVVRVAVTDTGRGIRAEDLDRVFSPFDRLGVEQTGIEGTGVGLALSKHLCERMGGRLLVDSVHEVGSTFELELPAATAATPVGTANDLPPAHPPGGTPLRPAGASDGVRAGPARPTPGRAFRVLLVEDNLTTLDLVERALSRRPGTEVFAAMQGGLGAELAREHRPDLILLDLQLPDMAGAAVLDRLAEDPVTAGIPVAVVGADSPTAEVRRLLSRGVMGFLAKPIDVRGLLSLVDAVRATKGA